MLFVVKVTFHFTGRPITMCRYSNNTLERTPTSLTSKVHYYVSMADGTTGIYSKVGTLVDERRFERVALDNSSSKWYFASLPRGLMITRKYDKSCCPICANSQLKDAQKSYSKLSLGVLMCLKFLNIVFLTYNVVLSVLHDCNPRWQCIQCSCEDGIPKSESNNQ